MTTLTLKGLVGREVAALFSEQLASIEKSDGPVTLDMREADIQDAAILAAIVESIRQAAARAGSVRILEPPQALAHGLYRLGTLAVGSTIQVIEPR